ncbi:MAG: hypothetical protein AB7V56_08060 [Candidatus Nitrosocosmicus sp.]
MVPDYLEEWKTAITISNKFDTILGDLRKYGFSLITGLITAGNFLGYSFSSSATINFGLIQIGVISITMLLVVILFWLDVYYQNLLYGSVFRTRFLEYFRVKFRLSRFISGIYNETGINKSSLSAVLYVVYYGFLSCGFAIGLISYQISYTKFPNYEGVIILITFFIISIILMLIITFKSIFKRQDKLNRLELIIVEGSKKGNELSESEIYELEEKILGEFKKAT